MLATWVPIPPAASLPTSDGAAQSGRKVVGVSEVSFEHLVSTCHTRFRSLQCSIHFQLRSMITSVILSMRIYNSINLESSKNAVKLGSTRLLSGAPYAAYSNHSSLQCASQLSLRVHGSSRLPLLPSLPGSFSRFSQSTS